MSIQSEITRINSNVQTTLNTIASTGVAVGTNSDSLPAAAQALANEKVSKSGDTMTGALTLSGDPTSALHAATKQYVDEAVANAGGSADLSEILDETESNTWTTEGKTAAFYSDYGGVNAAFYKMPDSIAPLLSSSVKWEYFMSAPSVGMENSDSGENVPEKMEFDGLSGYMIGSLAVFEVTKTGTYTLGEGLTVVFPQVGLFFADTLNASVASIGGTASASLTFSAPYTIPKLKEDLLPDHTHSWEGLTDRPFGEQPTGGDTLTWDGDTTGLESSELYYKVSDAVVTMDDLAQGVTLVAQDGQVMEVPPESFVDIGDGIVSDACTFVPSGGVYLLNSGEVYVASLTIPDYTGFPSVKTLDEKYLPESVALKSDLENLGGGSGVYVGEEEPTDETVEIWLNPNGDAISAIPIETIYTICV